jgi:hypothetical protein
LPTPTADPSSAIASQRDPMTHLSREASIRGANN